MDLRNLNDDTSSDTSDIVLIPREISLTLSYSSPTGEQFESVVRSRVPDGDGRMQIDRRTAVLAGVPWSQLSEYAQLRIIALATLSVHLVNIPDWVNTWVQEDDELLFTLRTEVENHSYAWFRSNMGESADDTSKKRISVSASHPTADTSVLV